MFKKWINTKTLFFFIGFVNIIIFGGGLFFNHRAPGTTATPLVLCNNSGVHGAEQNLMGATDAQAQQCVGIALTNCWWQGTGGGGWRSPICSSGGVLVGMQVYCSEDCGDQDEDWVKQIYCCQIGLQ